MHNILCTKVLSSLTFILLASVVGSCAIQKSPITGKKRVYRYSWQQELQIGRESDPVIVSEYGVYDDEEVAAYVVSVGERVLLASHLRRPETPIEYHIDFTFRVLDSPILNAFALPGGYVYVTRGLLAHMENEAQLAMVLGHEVAHVAARHSSQQALNSQLGQLGVIGAAVVGEVLAGAGQELLSAGSQASQLLLLSYSRGSESESDELGVEYAAKAGYKAGEGAGFFDTLQRITEKSGSRLPSWQSTHPDPGQRSVKILQMAAAWDSTLVMEEIGSEKLLAVVDSIVLGTNPRQGFVRDNVFYHPELAFQFPFAPDWTLYNLTSKVAITDPDQQSVVIITLAPGSSVVNAASDFAKSNQLTVRRNEARTINGLEAYFVDATFQQDRQSLRLNAFFIAHDDLIYRFVSYTYTRLFDQLSAALRQPAEGFRIVTDQNVLGTQPDRLQIFTAKSRGTLQSFVHNLPDQFEAEDVAILNQLRLTSEIAVGTKIKLIH